MPQCYYLLIFSAGVDVVWRSAFSVYIGQSLLFTSFCLWINPATHLTCSHDKHVWPQFSWITATCLPPGLGYIFKEVCSKTSNQWVALSFWEPTVEWVSWYKGSVWPVSLVWLWCHAPVSIMTTVCIYIPTVAFVTVTVRPALSTNQGNTSVSLALFPNWPQGFTVSLKNAAHHSATKEQIMRWNQRGIQWPLSCVNVDSSSRSSQHCSFFLQSVYQSVSPHMGLFLAGENCAVVCFCAGVGWGYGEEL